ncbi:hypothetical protein C7974DRAFT_381177 [Boeremia exigua]|uniref:uncharacterized protein n=1 Tax=Boeremia exigua TaxID=749465 RepID=UPI001E8D1BC0|nr:uncharacterized protein C7974DRAFT_381177 [Boeremia exigua]KAH6612662.1 hypothetical protein C7974DRAFT_381177 [Boeremia exigua]
MVSFSCENCGDVLTKKKLDPHRNQCYGASYTCLDCMVHFPGTSYRTHTACITEDQKYQGKLYKEKKPKGQQQKNNSQALTPHNAYVQDAAEEDNAVALVDAPPRAPTPPPAAHSLGYHQQAALPPVNVFDFLDNSATPSAPRTESRMIEDSAPPAYAETPKSATADVMSFQIPDDASFIQTGDAYGKEPVRPSSERFDSYTTPAPKSKKSKKDKDGETTTKKSERKRKRSPAELDLSAARARDRDTMMEDAPPVLHSGLTGGLNRLLARPEFPPSPDDSGDFANSPLSPMKRAKQGTSKALERAQREWENQEQRGKKADAKAEKERQKSEKKEKKDKDRGREKERKERKVSTALVKIRPKKNKDASPQVRRRRQYSSSVSPAPRDRKPKAIEYSSGSPTPDGNGQLVVRAEAGELALPVSTRAELFMSFISKGPDSERGVSVNKALKKYHRERHERREDQLHKVDEEKELWKDMRLKRNDRGEIVLFFASESS